MAYEICNFTAAQYRNHTDGTGSSETIREAGKLLEKSISSNTVQETAFFMLSAHQKTLELHRRNTEQSGNIQKYIQRMYRSSNGDKWSKGSKEED